MASSCPLPAGLASIARPSTSFDFGSQAAPNIVVIHTIHRAPDGFIPLAAKGNDGEWCELGALRVDQPMFPELFNAIIQDGYFGLNSSFRTGKRPCGTRRVWKPVQANHPEYGNLAIDFPGAQEHVQQVVYGRTSPITDLPFAHHDANSLRWLNLCHVDIDCYNKGLTVGEALGAIVDLQDTGRLPPPTMLARSGRGLWCFWLLVDPMNPRDGTRNIFGVKHDPWTPQRASSRALATYTRVQRALADRLAHLGADLGALDGARFAPVPGTLKTATQTRVEYWVQKGPQGSEHFYYTLPMLAASLGLPLADLDRTVTNAAPRDPSETRIELSEAGRRGWSARWRYLLNDLERLIQLRGGGFGTGCRNRGAFFYALILGRVGINAANIKDRVTTFGRKCRPALQVHEIRAALRQAEKGRTQTAFRGYVSNGRICDELSVTEREATYLCHLRHVPKLARVPKIRTTSDRRLAMRAVVQQLGYVPSTRDMVRFLNAQAIDGNNSTVWRDYRAMGFELVNQRGGRPKKAGLL